MLSVPCAVLARPAATGNLLASLCALPLPLLPHTPPTNSNKQTAGSPAAKERAESSRHQHLCMRGHQQQQQQQGAPYAPPTAKTRAGYEPFSRTKTERMFAGENAKSPAHMTGYSAPRQGYCTWHAGICSGAGASVGTACTAAASGSATAPAHSVVRGGEREHPGVGGWLFEAAIKQAGVVSRCGVETSRVIDSSLLRSSAVGCVLCLFCPLHGMLGRSLPRCFTLLLKATPKGKGFLLPRVGEDVSTPSA